MKLSMSLVALCACGAPERELGEGFGGGYGEPEGGAGGAPGCEEGDTIRCKIVLAEHEGVRTCIVGDRTCIDGAWGPCEGKANGPPDKD